MHAPSDIPYIVRGGTAPGSLVQGCALGPQATALRPAAGNRPPAGRAYLCIVPLGDAWRADPALAQRAGAPHFGTALEPAVLDDLRANRAVLVLDISNEGPDYFGNVFDALHDFAAGHAIAPDRMLWLSQNRRIEATYAAITGRGGADAIGFDHYDFFVKLAAWMFSPQARAPVLGPDPDAHAARMYDAATKDRLLLCLNATPRTHRVVTLAGLIHHGLFDRALVSFPGLALAKDGDVGTAERVAAFIAAHPDLDYLAPACRDAMRLEGLTVDSFAATGNALVDKVDTAPYRRSFFSLVTETELSDGSIHRVTEKAVKALCLGHPVLLVGNPYSLRFLADLGLHVFPQAIDPGYDNDSLPARRLNRVFGQAIALGMAIDQDPAGWLRRVRAGGEANIRHAASGRLLAAYTARHETPLLDRLGRLLAAG